MKRWPVCLHRTEWDRLKSQASPPKESCKKDSRNIKELIEQSQEWIRSWPDTFQGQVELQKQKNADQAKEIPNAGLEAFIKQRTRNETKQAIAKARQLVFQGSCYGKQLLSALLASKVIEEREAQIAFKREIQKKESELDKEKNNEELYFCKLDQIKRDKLQKKKNVLFADENKSMYEELNAKLKKDKKEEARLELEDAALMKGLLDYEKQEAERVKKCQKDQIREYEQEQREFRKTKMKREDENDEKVQKAFKEIDRMHMKLRQAHRQLIINKLTSSETLKLNYRLIEEMETAKRKHYEEFVEKAIKKHENTILKKEIEENDKRARERDAKKLLKKQEQIAIEETSQAFNEKDTCDRQCLFIKSHSERRKNQKLICKSADKPLPKSLAKKLQFLAPQKKLEQQLREREKQPSPWTGQSGAHAQFAHEAARTLAECKHKAMARKVVDEYRRLNCFDASTLPVQNY